MRHAFVTALSLLLFSPAALADVPAWTDDPPFERFCDELREKLSCPDCSCQAVTQSNPTEDASEVSGIPTGLVVYVQGMQEDGMNVRVMRAVLGAEGKLFDAGTIGDASSHMGQPRMGTVEIRSSAQHYDMCPGACPHSPVGMVHAFEVVTTFVDSDLENPERSTEETTIELALCFDPAGDSGPKDGAKPGCWLLPIGGSSAKLHYDMLSDVPPKQLKKTTWSRSWKLAGGDVTLTLGPLKGTVPRAIKQGPAAKAPKKGHLDGLPGRADVRAAVR